MNIKQEIKNSKILYGFARLCKSIYLYFTQPTSQDAITRAIVKYNVDRFKRYSGVHKESRIKDVSYLTWLYHVVEKGLAMPGMRYGFGHDKIIELDKRIEDFISKYGEIKQVLDAIAVIFEYDRIHQEANYKLQPNIQNIIDKWKNKYPTIEPVRQHVYTKAELYSQLRAEFPVFMKTRHSIRHFKGSVSIEQITKAVEIARFAPSACNRQPARVHIVADKDLKDKCLALQNGNRGFGHLADKLLIITGDLSTIQGGQEFFDLGTNVGIFIMNLCYGLHYNKIAHCILNWYALPKQDKELRKLVDIPDEETVFAFIVCGDVPDNFKIVVSPRIEANQIYTIHQ